MAYKIIPKEHFAANKENNSKGEKLFMDNYAKIEEIAEKYKIGLIYLFGSQKDSAKFSN